MGSTYRPQSPDLSSFYAPKSPDLSVYRPQSPDLSAALPAAASIGQPQHYNHYAAPFAQQQPHSYPAGPTSVPTTQAQYAQYGMPPAGHFKQENDDGDNDYLPDAPAKRARKNHQAHSSGLDANGYPYGQHGAQFTAPPQGISAPPKDPTRGVQLKTSFPVARIKRIMQADEDIGKVAQVTPHVVSRALELFMIKLISASADQARGAGPGGSGGSKGPKRILTQHMKRAVKADETFDFLADIVDKIPDAPSKAKKEAGSDSEDGAGGGMKSARKKGKKRKDSGDDF